MGETEQAILLKEISDFEKQEQEKQNITIEDVKERFPYRHWTRLIQAIAFYQGFREGYLQRGKEVLE